MPVKDITTKQFKNVIKHSQNPILVDFWAPWCGPCRALKPTVEAVSKQFDGKLDVYRCNLDKERSLAARYDIASIPTIIIFKSGKPVHTIVGRLSKGALIKEIKPYL